MLLRSKRVTFIASLHFELLTPGEGLNIGYRILERMSYYDILGLLGLVGTEIGMHGGYGGWLPY